jgi:serine/threonine protein kinase
MTPERWQQVETLVDAALDLPASERPAWLRNACGSDDALYQEVSRLVVAVDEPNAMLDVPTPAFAELVAHVESEGGAAQASIPARIGPWRVIAPAGEGGMGTVYLVERDDGQFRMRAALKMLRHGLHLDETFVKRFREERQILARLEHPNIARLLDGGVSGDGRPYYVMEYVDGAPIDRWCDERRLGITERLELFAKVCDAVAAAHAREIVHRDLKPSNVLVTRHGEAKLLDFGIAKTLAPLWQTAEWASTGASGTMKARTTLTRTGERLLTPEYASPEQIRGESATAATDVYALGVLLYELLTGQRPYHGRNRSRHEIERAILEETPTRPSAVATRPPPHDTAPDSPHRTQPSTAEAARARGLAPDELRRRLRGDLDTIVLAALRKEPERRYATAAELAADVRRHLDGRAVLARGDSAAYRARVWASRHRRTVIAAGLGMAAGVATLIAFADRNPPTLMAPSGLAEDVSTRSPLARRYYEDGLRAHARGNWGDAVRHFQSALREDSTFAMAAMYGSEAASRDENYAVSNALLRQSIRQAARGSERERLIVLASYAWRQREPTLVAYTDTLARRFPQSSAAHLWRGRALAVAGEWEAAAHEFRLVVAADSAVRANDQVPCHSCAARVDLVGVWVAAYKLEDAEREARELTSILPEAASSWQMLALVQQLRGRPADGAFRRRVELDPGDADYAVEMVATQRMREGDFRAADDLLRSRMETAPPGREERAMGWLVTSLRMQERWREALDVARRFRRLAGAAPAGAAHPAAVPEANVLFESGRALAAAALYDSIGRWSDAATHRIWQLTHHATALAAAGDTAPLAAIVDTIKALVPASGNGRDARLPHHVEGLLLVARGRDADAVDAFRKAIFSWNMGYTRTNLELGRALLRLGRPQEAVAALQPALQGGLEVNNSYVTHTALHRTLAHAWQAAGNADSAAVHLRWVRTALLHADANRRGTQ